MKKILKNKKVIGIIIGVVVILLALCIWAMFINKKDDQTIQKPIPAEEDNVVEEPIVSDENDVIRKEPYIYCSGSYDEEGVYYDYNCLTEKCAIKATDCENKKAFIYDGKYYIYDIKTEQREEINVPEEKINKALQYDDNNEQEALEVNYYYVNGQSVFVTYYYDADYLEFLDVYDANFDKFNGNNHISDCNISSDNKVVYYVNDKLYKAEPNRTIINTSKSYDELIGIYDDYAAVVDNSYLKLVDNNGNDVTTWVKLKDSYTVHDMLSGWYEKKENDYFDTGIYIIVGQDDVTDEDIKKAADEKHQKFYDGMPYGYEYYYIPSTKESGKVATQIGGYAKPVLYLYPEKTTNVSVRFAKPNLLTTTYPKYNKLWEVTANPNGDLYDKNNKYYYGLYWEESGSSKVNFKEGFYVEKQDAIKFLESTLTKIGLNDRERNEFIMYWLPILEKNGKNLVYYEFTEQRDSYNKLIIEPKPDSLLRLAIHVKKINTKQTIKKQSLPTFERKGFTAVEWGGVVH